MASKSAARPKVPMESLRKTSLAAGILYLITFVSIPILFLYNPVKEMNYVLGSGPDTRMMIGGLLEMIVALAGIGTAVALYPVLKRQNQGVALGLVGARTLEASAIFVGATCCTSRVWFRGLFLCWHSSQRLCFSLPLLPGSGISVERRPSCG